MTIGQSEWMLGELKGRFGIKASGIIDLSDAKYKELKQVLSMVTERESAVKILNHYKIKIHD